MPERSNGLRSERSGLVPANVRVIPPACFKKWILFSQDMITQERCLRLLNKVRKDFPELDKIKIHLKINPLKRGSMRATRLYGNYEIVIDPEKYDDARDSQIIGAIAHELMHLEDFSRKSWLNYFFWFIHYRLSKSYMIKEELWNDVRTIKRGYGKELARNRAYRIKKSPLNMPKNKRPYMLPEEIKQYMKKHKLK